MTYLETSLNLNQRFCLNENHIDHIKKELYYQPDFIKLSMLTFQLLFTLSCSLLFWANLNENWKSEIDMRRKCLSNLNLFNLFKSNFNGKVLILTRVHPQMSQNWLRRQSYKRNLVLRKTRLVLNFCYLLRVICYFTWDLGSQGPIDWRATSKNASWQKKISPIGCLQLQL